MKPTFRFQIGFDLITNAMRLRTDQAQVVEAMSLHPHDQANAEEGPVEGSRARTLTTWGLWACRGGVAVLLLCCAGTMLFDLYRGAQVERALADIQRAGGLYKRQETGRARAVIGIDLDATVVFDTGEVVTRGHFTDEILPSVARFTRLEELSLNGADVTDDGLLSLQGLIELRRLYLSRTRVTDAGLGYLKGLRSLRTIDLRGTRVTPAGLRTLQRVLPRAQILSDASPSDRREEARLATE
jgi:hypothetical protein